MLWPQLIGAAPKSFGAELASPSQEYFLSLLDADVLGSGAGVSKANFEAIFCVCGKCFSHMTRRIAVSHECGGESSQDGWPYQYLPLPINSP